MYKLPRIYLKTALESNSEIKVFDSQIINKLHKVLRLRAGDSIRIFNSDDGEFLGLVNNISKKMISINLKEKIREPEKKSDLILIVPVIKSDRLRWMVEKITELGVGEIIFYNPLRSQLHSVNIEKINAYITAASEQSERCNLPEIKTEKNIKTYIAENKDINFVVAYEHEKESHLMTEEIQGKTAFIFGPEGGFTNDELQAIGALQNVKSVHLGRRILRVETAAIYCASIFQYVNCTSTTYPRVHNEK